MSEQASEQAVDVVAEEAPNPWHCLPIFEEFKPETRKKMARAYRNRNAGEVSEFGGRSSAYRTRVDVTYKGKRFHSVCPIAFCLMEEERTYGDQPGGTHRSILTSPGGGDISRQLLGIGRYDEPDFNSPEGRRRGELSREAERFYGPWDSFYIKDLADAACLDDEIEPWPEGEPVIVGPVVEAVTATEGS